MQTEVPEMSVIFLITFGGFFSLVYALKTEQFKS